MYIETLIPVASATFRGGTGSLTQKPIWDRSTQELSQTHCCQGEELTVGPCDCILLFIYFLVTTVSLMQGGQIFPSL